MIHLPAREGARGGQTLEERQEGATPTSAMADSLSHIRAKAMRRQMTPPEARLWQAVRAGRMNGLKWRRQHPVGPFILDFYCAVAALAVEVDGAVHDDPDQIARDRRRTAWLERQGLKVIRIASVDVRDDLDGVLDYVLRTVRERRAASESPPPGR